MTRLDDGYSRRGGVHGLASLYGEFILQYSLINAIGWLFFDTPGGRTVGVTGTYHIPGGIAHAWAGRGSSIVHS